MNPGGEPERDESGLPPVDIEIPDDARELDRDVQAYHREIRAQRRQQRSSRVRGTLAKDGIVLPLLACCLILALITGTLLTVFTTTSNQDQLGPGTAGHPPATSRSPSGGATSGAPSSSAATSSGAPTANTAQVHPPPATLPGRLPPQATIAIGGQVPWLVQKLSRAALVLVPSHCACTATVSWLIFVVTRAHAQPYLVYTADTKVEVEQLYMSLSGTDRAHIALASAPDDALRESIPATLPEDDLAAILLGPKAVVYATGLGPKDDASTLIEALTH